MDIDGAAPSNVGQHAKERRRARSIRGKWRDEPVGQSTMPAATSISADKIVVKIKYDADFYHCYSAECEQITNGTPERHTHKHTNAQTERLAAEEADA